jgi:uncharacterized protein (TIGR00369 family)
MVGLKERLRAVSEGRAEPPPIMATFGMKIVQFSVGEVTLTMKVDERYHNPMGTLHGGIMTDLADASMGVATMSTLAKDETFTTLELKMNFLRPVQDGWLTSEAKVLHRGKRIALVEAVVKDSKKKQIARGIATQMVLPIQKKKAGPGQKLRARR